MAAIESVSISRRHKAHERSVDQLEVRDAAPAGEAELAVCDVPRQSVVGEAST